MAAESPHLVHVHCIAHRVALVASNAWKDIEAICQFRRTVSGVHNLFRYSAARYACLRELHKAMDPSDFKSLKEPCSVRWLSLTRAVDSIKFYSTVTGLVLFSVSRKRGSGGMRQLLDYWHKSKLSSLLPAYICCSTSFPFLTPWADASKRRMSPSGPLNQESPGETPLDGPERWIWRERGAFHARKIFSCRAHFLRSKAVVCDACECTGIQDDLHELYWRIDLQLRKSISRARFGCLVCPRHYFRREELPLGRPYAPWSWQRSPAAPFWAIWPASGKQACVAGEPAKPVFAVKVHNACTWSSGVCWHRTFIQEYNDTFPAFAMLANIALAIPVSSVPCECGFSVQNHIKTSMRMRLTNEHVDNLMLITVEGPRLPEADYFLRAACEEFSLRKNRQKF